MSKAVLLSIHPKWCELIASGKKTVEVRKTKPKLDVPFKCYIYCTRYEKGKLIWKKGNKFIGYKLTDVSGKVIGEFVCDKILEICIEISNPNYLPDYPFPCTGLTDKEIMQYLGNGKTGYGWHISNLIIYDEPKELSEFWNANKCHYASEDGCTYKYHCFRAGQKERCGNTLHRPPQSWCYVEDGCYE